MPNGVTSGPWGYSIPQVGGLSPRSEIGLHPLFYEEALTSYPPRFINRQFVSPLTRANRALYSPQGVVGTAYLPQNNVFNNNTHYFLKFDNFSIDIIEKLNNHVFPSNTVGPRSLSKPEVNEVINKTISGNPKVFLFN